MDEVEVLADVEVLQRTDDVLVAALNQRLSEHAQDLAVGTVGVDAEDDLAELVEGQNVVVVDVALFEDDFELLLDLRQLPATDLGDDEQDDVEVHHEAVQQRLGWQVERVGGGQCDGGRHRSGGGGGGGGSRRGRCSRLRGRRMRR